VKKVKVEPTQGVRLYEVGGIRQMFASWRGVFCGRATRI
jgi:hypothetical protein